MSNNYKVRVIITDPNTPKGMTSGLQYKLECRFIVNPDDYGKKTYLSINSKDCQFENNYDLRYDPEYHPSDQKGFIQYWATNYWSGKNGAWTIQHLEIQEV